MSGKSNYLENLLLNWLTGSAMGSSPAGLYCALFNGDPTDAGTGGTEVTATIRPAGRVAITLGSVTTSTGANSKANSAATDFGAANAAVAQMTHFSIWDSPTPGSGNMLYSNALTGQPIAVSLGADVNFPIGSLVTSED